MALGRPSADLVVVVHLEDAGARAAIERRLQTGARAYAAMATPAWSIWWQPALQTLTAALRLDGTAVTRERPVTWGWDVGLDDEDTLLDATDPRLRAFPTPSCAIAMTPHGGRLATSSGAVQVLYRASGRGVQVWSTHALMAGHVTGGDLQMDPESVVELVACGFVSGDATLLDGVRALEPGTCVEFQVDGPRERSCFPPAERWAPMDPDGAPAAAEAALLRTLEAAVEDASHPLVGLTAGLDSLTVAVALRELDVPFRGFTFDAGQSHADIQGAERVAAALDVEHTVAPLRWYEGAAELDRALARSVWHDGESEVGFGQVEWPSGGDRWITGMGAETGRAFFWGAYAGDGDDVRSRVRLNAMLRLRFEPVVVGIPPARLRAVRSRWDSWVAEAERFGHRGLDALDVVYAQHRVRRWGRSELQPEAAPLVPAFASPEMTRALCSLSIEDRLTDGWQRRFVQARTPELHADAAPRVFRSMRKDQATLALRRLRRSSGLTARPRPKGFVWHQAEPWVRHDAFIGWLRDGVLTSSVLEEALGRRWLTEQRRKFIAGDPQAARSAGRAAGAVALADATARLARAVDAYGRAAP